MYKFRASTHFESLPMPGTSARLFDVKRAIVRAKKLDKSSGGPQLEFDFSVKNAMTHEAYDDESMLLPRGSRLIVQRLPASRGHGLLSKIARSDAGISSIGAHVAYGNTAAAQSGFYTMESHKGEQDEFVDAHPAVLEAPESNTDEDGDDSQKELAALNAVVQATNGSSTAFSRSAQPGKFRSSAGVGGVPLPTMAVPNFKQHNNSHFHSRPNADPELRDQEHRLSQAPKKNRATGIPRTFLNITKQPTADPDGTAEGENGDDGAVDNSMVKLQPNDRGFKALVSRGGGLSGSGVGGKRHDLDYALKITARDIPDHLQCGICSQVVKNAMLISWDTEGRTACEFCMRDGLANNGYRCPLTGNEGVSPDDLFPNIGLRKAAELFEQDVIRCMLEIVEQQEADEEEERKISTKYRGTEYEGDSMDKGISMQKKTVVLEKKRRHSDDFGDDFGADVFDMSNDVVTSINKTEDKAIATNPPQNENKNEIIVNNSNKSIAESADDSKKSVLNSGHVDSEKDIDMTNDQSKNVVHSSPFLQKTLNSHPVKKSVPPGNNLIDNQKEASHKKQPPPPTTANRKEMLRKRGVPAGYVMGPAGGPPPKKLSVSSHADTASIGSMGEGRGRVGQGNYNHHHGGTGEEMNWNTFDQGGGFRGRGRGRGGGRFHQEQKPTHVQQMDGGGGGGRGNRGGFGQTNYPNRGGRTAQQGWRGDDNGRGNPSAGNGDYLKNNQDGQQLGGNNPNNHFGPNGHFSQNGKRPRSGSFDRHSSSGQHEHANRGPPDEQGRHFRNNNNWQQNGGRGRGLDQRANGFDHRGRGDFHRGGPGRGDSYSQGRRGRGDFSRGRGGGRRGRF